MFTETQTTTVSSGKTYGLKNPQASQKLTSDSPEAPLKLKSIFNYLNYREFLKDFYLFKKSRNSNYSYAVFSQKAGIKSPNYLKLVMEGSRNITADILLPFAKALALDDLETIYWENLVAFNQARTPEQKQHYLMRLTKSVLPANQADGAMIREIRDEWDYFASWHHAAIRELVLLGDFNENPKEVAKLLRGRITEEQARESLALLLRRNFLIRNAEGKLIQAQPQVRYFNKADIANVVIQRFHHSTSELALESIEKDGPNERDFSCLTIAVTEDSLQAIKSRLTEFRKTLNKEFSCEANAQQVYQINFQVVPLTEPNKGKQK